MASFQSLPGFRDFYPEDFSRRQHIFRGWSAAANSFGFQEYDAPGAGAAGALQDQVWATR
jgi:histidyl-tRNA synthetase